MGGVIGSHLASFSAGAEQRHLWLPGIQHQSWYYHHSFEVYNKSTHSFVDIGVTYCRCQTYSAKYASVLKWNVNLASALIAFCSGIKDKNFMLHYEVSHSVKLLFFLYILFKEWILKHFLYFPLVSSVCNQWDWKGGRHEQEGARTRLVLQCTSLRSVAFSDFSLMILCLCVCVCVKGRWLKKLWDQSSPKTSRSPSESLRRCWSPTVSDSKVSLVHFESVRVNTWRLVKLPQLTVLPVCTAQPPAPTSTGSSSMASACGGSLALMDAGNRAATLRIIIKALRAEVIFFFPIGICIHLHWTEASVAVTVSQVCPSPLPWPVSPWASSQKPTQRNLQTSRTTDCSLIFWCVRSRSNRALLCRTGDAECKFTALFFLSRESRITSETWTSSWQEPTKASLLCR